MGTPVRSYRPTVDAAGRSVSNAAGPIFDDGPIAFEAPKAPVRPEHAETAWDAARAKIFTKRGTLRKDAQRSFGIDQTASTNDDIEPSVLSFPRERRKLPRRVVKGNAMAIFASGRGAGTLTRVELLDASWTGLGLKSTMVVEPGTSVSVIPEHAMSPRHVGIVVRCEAVEGGYHVGLMCRVQRAVA